MRSQGGLLRIRVFLVLTALLLLFARLGNRGLLETSEARYAETAREMWLAGDWITPRFFGVKHFHKPPLTYWITEAGYALLGVHEWGARFFLGVAALVTLWLVYWLGKTWFSERTGLIAAGLLLTSPLFTAFTRVLTTDLYLTCSTTAAIAAHAAGRSGNRRGYPLMWAALGAGFLLKGPVVFLVAVAPILVFEYLRGEEGSFEAFKSASGLVLFALIAAPWFVAVCLRNPGLFTQLVVYETWQRVTTTVHGRIGPWYYFIGVFSVGFFPWIFLVPAAVRERWAAIRDARNGYESLCFCWFAVPFVAFSASKSKLIAYILPVFPAAALLLARWIDRALENDEVPRTATRTTLVGALLSLAGIAWVLHVDRPAALEGVATHVMFFYPVLGLLVMAADRAERKGRLRPLLAAMAVVSLVFPALVAPFADEAEGDFKMMRPLAMAIRKLAKPGAPVVLCGFGATSIPFYIERSVCTFECASDLHYEKNRAELAKQHFEDMGRLVEMLEQGPVYLVADDEMRQRIDRAQWPRTHRRLRILATERRYMLLADPDR